MTVGRAEALELASHVSDRIAAWTDASGAVEVLLALTGMFAPQAEAHPVLAANAALRAKAVIAAAGERGDPEATMEAVIALREAWQQFTQAAGLQPPRRDEWRARLP